jgi:hypothetical protein
MKATGACQTALLKEETVMRNSFNVTRSAALLLALWLGGCAMNASAQPTAKNSSSTLYKRLGGYDFIASVKDYLIKILSGD